REHPVLVAARERLHERLDARQVELAAPRRLDLAEAQRLAEEIDVGRAEEERPEAPGRGEHDDERAEDAWRRPPGGGERQDRAGGEGLHAAAEDRVDDGLGAIARVSR